MSFVAFMPRVCGSSPLTRGAPAQVVKRRHLDGLIPADAGSTGGCVRMFTMTTAHPR